MLDRLRLANRVRSSDEEYSRLLVLAVSFVAVWPVGVPLLFLVVLLNCREAIMQGRMSRLVRSTSFLHRECTGGGLDSNHIIVGLEGERIE